MEANRPVNPDINNCQSNPLPSVEGCSIEEPTDEENVGRENQSLIIHVKCENSLDKETVHNMDYFPEFCVIKDEIVMKRLKQKLSKSRDSILKLEKGKELQIPTPKSKAYFVCICVTFLSQVFLLIFCLEFGPFFGLSSRVTYWIITGITIFIGICICLYKRLMGICKGSSQKESTEEKNKVSENPLRVRFSQWTEVYYT